MDEPILDCLIIGGGPAGLTAAIYLARFHLDILVVDGGKSRAAWIPCTHNHAGFPTASAATSCSSACASRRCKYGAKIETEPSPSSSATRIRPLHRHLGLGRAKARTVLLATGITNRRPPMDEDLHDDALARGLIRYCPICDGYEVTDKKVGVIGSDSHGVAEALFIRSYTADVTLIAPDMALRSSDEDRRKLKDAGIDCVDGPAQAVAITGDCIVVDTAEGHYTFDTIYPALGSDTHTQLGEMVGAKLAADGCYPVRRPPADQRSGPLCRGRRRARPRPNQPRDGRRRRRSDDDPQRPVRAEPRWRASRLAKWRKLRAEARRGIPVEDDPAIVKIRDSVTERDQRAFAVFQVNFEQVARAVIFDGDDQCRLASLRDRMPAHRSGRRDNIRPLPTAEAPSTISTSDPRSASAPERSPTPSNRATAVFPPSRTKSRRLSTPPTKSFL